uniref:Uncharacterized protein n=1 Tax=Manihot esculenta TaxID=3983 RepID=A0A2C9WEZ6_MANES
MVGLDFVNALCIHVGIENVDVSVLLPLHLLFHFSDKDLKVPVITPKKTGKRRRKIQSRKNIGFFNTNLVFDCGGLSSVENLKPHVIEKVNDSL